MPWERASPSRGAGAPRWSSRRRSLNETRSQDRVGRERGREEWFDVLWEKPVKTPQGRRERGLGGARSNVAQKSVVVRVCELRMRMRMLTTSVEGSASDELEGMR